MYKPLIFLIALLTLTTCEPVNGVEPNDRVVATKNGKTVVGVVSELISGDSKAVVKSENDGGGKTVIVLVDSIKYVSPPMVEQSQVRRWKSSNGEFSIEAALVSRIDNAVFLQRRDGIVIRVTDRSLSREDRQHIERLSDSSTNHRARAGDAVELVIPKQTPVDRKTIANGLQASFARSGYSVKPKAKLRVVVAFQKGKTEKNEMYGLNGKQIVEFTPWTTTVELKRDDDVLWKRVHTTKSPYTLPGGQAGIDKLKKAEFAMVPFLKTLGVPPVIK